ncbi:MAG: FkbM family methyltransferase [Thermoplasmata archaeon]|nr:FkbM family methyltransferase [Thermoplasmata archaeon]
MFELRPESDDLDYVLPRTATPMAGWFRPKPGQNVVEVGAHIGVNTLIAARLGARVAAFEANPETVEALRRNLALNHADGVRVVCAAAGSREAVGELRVPLLASGFGSFRTEWVDEARTPANSPIRRLRVQIVRLDDTLDEVAWPTIDWLLVDAEGSEAEVLSGAELTLARANRVIIEVDARSSHPTSERVALLLRGAGLTVISKFPQFAFTDYWLAERNPIG